MEPPQLAAVFQSVLVSPFQSAALAAETPNETAMTVTRGTPKLELRSPEAWIFVFMVFLLGLGNCTSRVESCSDALQTVMVVR
jgi:hypothetical protein